MNVYTIAEYTTGSEYLLTHEESFSYLQVNLMCLSIEEELRKATPADEFADPRRKLELIVNELSKRHGFTKTGGVVVTINEP